MKSPSADLLPKLRARERVVVHVDSLAARCIGALALLCAACWLVAILAHHRHQPQWHYADRLGWSLAVLAAVALMARGIFLGRPVTTMHAGMAALFVLAGLGSHALGFDPFGDVLIAGSGLVLMWPTSSHPQPEKLSCAWALINATTDDPLAPFAMQTGKSYHFSASGTAALAYRTRMGFAVVGGDPIGDEAQFPELIADFAAMCHTHGWRIAVVGCSERRLALWNDRAVIRQSLRAVPIGRDVVIDVSGFDMVGRKFRNLRQAVQRTHNAGITTEIVAEQELDHRLLAELTEVVRASPSGAHTDRGFYMNLDGVLEGRFPGIRLIIARDADGRVQGFHRYATAGGGSDITLDVPWRRRGAPNGIDERLSVDMIMAGKDTGAQRVSLSFAAFPEIFDDKNPGRLQRVCYRLIHLLDPLIALESLYRYVHKFHALDARRYALISLTQLAPLVFVLLTLEFMPRRRHL
ncbi:bifunctional lysylphosphatidylglycerol flippase/synthetase MprF [Mycobacterium sp. Aquia_213]|uniref:bifunctional lysylphosphatidylglycerol flippase/synthetase MprF n=1 Tax=Mycobacterium sp. Aquia_213 TaxID=2991728 RepID=UPI00227063E0|nr:phosphatidylglycerol lysyltransferase domain-containing protein [Mycobacterium sp. Aquia_213]WAC89384.1 phosphatidylglycerol lysyltransferase domain-containing protein [Mycobacterium sp. Aquia_213]